MSLFNDLNKNYIQFMNAWKEIESLSYKFKLMKYNIIVIDNRLKVSFQFIKKKNNSIRPNYFEV